MSYLILATLAAIGFLVSLVCNVMGWMHTNPFWGQSVFWLHIGAMALFFALIYFSNKTMPKFSKSNLDHLLAELPKWARTGLGVVFAYAILNFVWFIYCSSTYQKGKEPMWLVLRGFSGHWMLFFGVS